MSPADQEAMRSISGEAFAKFAGAGWDRADKEGREIMQTNGNKVQQVSPAFLAALKGVTDKLEIEYADKMDKMGLKGREVITYFRGEVTKARAGN